MESYTASFSRTPSNPKILRNQHFLSKKRLQPIEDINRTESNMFQHQEMVYPKMALNAKELEDDYQPASFDRAVQYKLSRSYCLKQPDGSYKELQLLEPTKSLKNFGLGPYFYVQFMRRAVWVVFWACLLSIIVIYINSKSTGLSNYSTSFSTYLITTTLGNFNNNGIVSGYDCYIVSLMPAFIFAILSLFYLCWKCHFYSQIDQEENNNATIRPQKFCIEVESQDDSVAIDQDNLRSIFGNFGPVHQISIIKRHKNKLQYFERLQSMEEEIHQIELQLRFEEGDPKKLVKLRQEKQDLMKELSTFYINPKTVSAYIHFEYQKSKIQCLAFFDSHYLYNTCSHCCFRSCCCCCLAQMQDRYLINSRSKVLIRQVAVPAPQDINWESFELSFCSKLCRYVAGMLIVLVFLAISCIIIGLCTIYVSTHSSNCDSVTIPSSLAVTIALNDATVKTCYCNANLIAALTDSAIQNYCSSELSAIYIAEGIQYAIILTSALTNFLFGFVVDRIVDCTRPTSQSQNLKVKTLTYTFFLIFNTIFLPILLYSNIFGFKSSSYFSFLTVICSGLQSFLSVDSLQFYLDYNQIWYRNVSPIFTNYLIFDILGVWLMYLIYRCRSGYASLVQKERKILQKHMNAEITSFQFSPYKEYSSFLMVIFMTFFLSSGIPILLPLAWANLVSRYITNRLLTQYFSTRVDGLGVAFNQLAHTLLPVLIIAGCVNGCWMLTANATIYPSAMPFSIYLGDINSWIVMQRELYLPFFIIIALIISGEYLFYHFIIRFCTCICSKCSEQKMVALPSYSKTFSEHKKRMNVLTSYNIKSNDKMRNAVTRMELYIKNRLK